MLCCAVLCCVVQSLVVAGVQYDALSAFCFPTLAVYTFNAATQSWSNAAAPEVIRLLRPSPAKSAASYLPPVSAWPSAARVTAAGVAAAATRAWSNVPCTASPQNQLSVDVSTQPSPQGTRNVVVGVPGQTWYCSRLAARGSRLAALLASPHRSACALLLTCCSPDGVLVVVVVVVTHACVSAYVSSLYNLSLPSPVVSVQCLPSSVHSPLGVSVGWSSADGSQFSVASDQSVVLVSTDRFVAAAAQSAVAGDGAQGDWSELRDFQVPNRVMLATSAGAARSIRQAVSSSLGTLALLATDAQLPDTELFPAIVLPPGELFSYNRYVLKKCPTGRFKAGWGLQPCAYCPAGTYFNGTGATACVQCAAAPAPTPEPRPRLRSGSEPGPEPEPEPAEVYCPTGSVTPYALSEFEPLQHQSIPAFEADEYREVFEDLLISTLFSLTRYRVVAVWLALTAACIVLAVLSQCGGVRGCKGIR